MRAHAGIVAVLAAGRAAVGTATAAVPKPNFVFILADDWGWGDCGFNTGINGHSHTPSLDSLATTGVTFSDFHTASPVCSPSRAAFMTGIDPSRLRIHTALNVNWTTNGVQGQASYLNTSVPTVTALLQAAGYRTGHFGKWHLGSGAQPGNPSHAAPLPTEYGIDESCTFNSNDPCTADARTSNTSVDIVRKAEVFMAKAKADNKPFYVNIWLHVSHDRLDPSEAQKAASKYQCARRNFATNQTDCAQNIFTAAQQDADAQIGQLNTLMGTLNLHESTLILFSTDNGPEDVAVYSNAKGSAGPFRARKRSLYDGGTRVPSFAVFGGSTPKPTIPSHTVEHTPISASDWLPTVLTIAGVVLPADLLANIDGEDMSQVFLRQAAGQRAPVPRAKMLFWEWRFAVAGTCENAAPNIAVRDGVWKYMQNADGTRPELYKLDLWNASNPQPDFNERHNLAATYPGRVAVLKAAVETWHKTCPPLPANGLPANPGCDGFSGPSLRPAVFGSGGADTLANVAVGGQAQPVWEDSEPDRWLDSASGKHISF